jgi:hypothetical protein
MAAQSNRYHTLTWRKSSASAGTGECVEVARSGPFVLARDSADLPGVILAFEAAPWRLFTQRVKDEGSRPAD